MTDRSDAATRSNSVFTRRLMISAHSSWFGEPVKESASFTGPRRTAPPSPSHAEISSIVVLQALAIAKRSGSKLRLIGEPRLFEFVLFSLLVVRSTSGLALWRFPIVQPLCF